MKMLSVEEAQARFATVCQEALAGEVIRFRLANGALLQLMQVPAVPAVPAPSDQELAQGYDDPDWAAFENHCAAASA
jgi:hypothetical protein